jgi:hypothetical protein
MGSGTPIMVALPIAAVTILFSVAAHGGGFEPFYPTNEQLRSTIKGVLESQTFRPPVALEQSVRQALRSIKETEGRTNQRLAGLLSTRLKGTWTELERSRVVGELGYTEFDDETFHAAEAKFREVLIQFVGARAPYSEERYRGALRALDDAQALCRTARRAVPGLASDDVLLMRGKRQILLLKEPPEDRSSVRSGGETAPSR